MNLGNLFTYCVIYVVIMLYGVVERQHKIQHGLEERLHNR
jgi:hypothetical protein